jgi:hypothetical protein
MNNKTEVKIKGTLINEKTLFLPTMLNNQEITFVHYEHNNTIGLSLSNGHIVDPDNVTYIDIEQINKVLEFIKTLIDKKNIMKNECIIYTEDYYKPNQKILDLDDHVIELWYNKLSLEFVKLLRKIDKIQFGDNSGEKVVFYLFYDNDKFFQDGLITFEYNTKHQNFIIRNDYFNDILKHDIRKLDKIVSDLFKHLL